MCLCKHLHMKSSPRVGRHERLAKPSCSSSLTHTEEAQRCSWAKQVAAMPEAALVCLLTRSPLAGVDAHCHASTSCGWHKPARSLCPPTPPASHCLPPPTLTLLEDIASSLNTEMFIGLKEKSRRSDSHSSTQSNATWLGTQTQGWATQPPRSSHDKQDSKWPSSMMPEKNWEICSAVLHMEYTKFQVERGAYSHSWYPLGTLKLCQQMPAQPSVRMWRALPQESISTKFLKCAQESLRVPRNTLVPLLVFSLTFIQKSHISSSKLTQGFKNNPPNKLSGEKTLQT